MIYQLPNGKAIEISVEQYFRMSDHELNSLVANNWGEEINDPFALSVLRHGPVTSKEERMTNFGPGDFDEENVEDLTDVTSEDKLYDPDFIDYDNLEE
jgi:hypothetical protein